MSHEDNQRTTHVPRPVVYYFFANVFLWLCCMGTIVFWKFVEHRVYPYNSPFMPAPLFRDLWCYRPQFLAIHSIDFFKDRGEEMFPYPPGSALAFSVFHNLLPKFHSIPFFSITFFGVSSLAVTFTKFLANQNVEQWKAVLLVTSGFLLMFPFWFVWTTGNIEIVLFLVLSSGMIAYLRGHLALAAILVGLAASMKLYPFVMLALFLPIKRYKETLLAIGTFFVSSLAGLWLMCPNISFAWRGSQSALRTNRVEYMQTFFLINSAADHSIWGFVKTVVFVLSEHSHLHFQSRSVTAYTGLSALLGLALYFSRIRLMPLLNQIFCLYLCMLLLVPESFEYTLIHLSVLWGLLVVYTFMRDRRGHETRSLTPVFLCLAFVLSAENELVHYRGYWGQAKCLVLIILLGLALTRRWEGFEEADWVAPELRLSTTQLVGKS